MAAIYCHHALPAVGRSVPHISLGAHRHAGTSFPFYMTPSNYPPRLVSRAAISIPPDALVRRKKTKDDQEPWGIEDKDEVVKLWFLIPGVDVSNVQKDVDVNLPDGSNVLTIKTKKEKMKAAADADELLDVRLLLTEDYDRKGIKVEGTNQEGKVRLEVTTQKATTPFHKIEIN